MRRIELLRKRCGLRQKDLAAAVGVAPNVVSAWERGKRNPTGGRMPLLARALGVTVEELRGWEEAKT